MKISRKRDYFAIFLILFFLGILSWMFYSYFSHNLIYDLFENNTSEIVEYIREYNSYSYIIFVLLIVLECVFAPFPPLILYIVGGSLFGWFIGGGLALIGNFLGAGIAFLLSHYYGKEKFIPKIPKRMRKKFDKLSTRYGPISIFILRINPITSSDLFSYLAGLTNMKFWKFLIATTLGLLPLIYFQTYLGESIQSHPLIAKLSTLVGVLYLILFFVAYFWIKKKK